MASTKDLAKQFLLELDQEITAERLRIADLKERTISNKGQKAWNRIRASETKHLYNLKERRHVLTLVHAFPNKNWGYQ